MSTTILASTLFSSTRGAVFGELFRRPDGVYLRELERITGINARHLLREMHRLRDAGIISPTKVGNVVLYKFDPECPIYEDLQSIVLKTVGLVDAIREMLEPFSDKIRTAYIYGSYARGEQRTNSDVDLMIVGSVTRQEISSATRRTAELLRREVNTTIYASTEYEDALQDENSFVAKVHAGSRIDLVVDS